MRKNIAVWEVKTAGDLAAHYAIRHRVFVIEQGVLVLTDVDENDDRERVVHVLASNKGTCAGSVRLYPLDGNGRWKGDRLAVLSDHRTTIVGAQLVRFATATAAAMGGRLMEASIQLANVKFFERLGWVCNGEPTLVFGLPHQTMLFDLKNAPEQSWADRPAIVNCGVLNEDHKSVLCPQS